MQNENTNKMQRDLGSLDMATAPSLNIHKNSIMTLYPYIWNGIWVFDDEATGLVREAFVAGADVLCDYILDECKGQDFILYFSATPFPDAKIVLDLVKTRKTGSDYIWNEYNHKVWLCPALFKYFPKAPDNIYIDYKPIEHERNFNRVDFIKKGKKNL